MESKIKPFDKKLKLTIKDLDTFKAPERLNALFPNIVRAIICGPSNCGKTNVLLNILNKIHHSNIIVCSKTSYQEKYKLLEHLINNFNQICEKNDMEPRKYQNLSLDSLPNPEEIPSCSIIIFDDISTEQQEKISNYFAYGRHNQISCFYLCQTYSKIPKQLIRDNANYIILLYLVFPKCMPQPPEGCGVLNRPCRRLIPGGLLGVSMAGPPVHR